MRFRDILLVAIMVFQVCVVGPFLMVFWNHTVSLERRTAVLCSFGMQAGDPVACPNGHQ